MGVSAWKEIRAGPLGGALQPVERQSASDGGLRGFASNVPGIDDGVYHYLSRDHALELRCWSATTAPEAPARLWIGLSSVHWREAWKYGERAFRYCQLDVGHALGALRYAAGGAGVERHAGGGW